MKKYRTIGIVGGMGPEATAELYLRIIKIFQTKYAAKYDADFPAMVIINLPIPDVVESFKERQAAQEMLVEGARKLESAGVDFIIIPCNTVNFFLSAIRDAVSVPVLNLLEEVANTIAGVRKVALLGTETTINRNIYGSVLRDAELLVPKIGEQKTITKIIMNILRGDKNEEDKIFLTRLINRFKRDGAEKVILGCTELPLLVKENKDTLDTVEILAQAAVREAMIFEE